MPVHLDGGCISIRNLLRCVYGGVSQLACDSVVVDSNFAARNLKRLSGSTDVAVALSETVASLVGTEKHSLRLR